MRVVRQGTSAAFAERDVVLQIVDNLLRNAIEASPPGAGERRRRGGRSAVRRSQSSRGLAGAGEEPARRAARIEPAAALAGS